MKIVQTFWTTKSCETPLSELLQLKFGWLSPEFHWLSWGLSCLQLATYYNDIELYTDENGKRILIDLFGLPYSAVHITHENLESIPPTLWAFSKIHTYSLQTSPFLHVDGDVYIWEPFNEDLLNASLIAQNREIDFPFYEKALSDMMVHFRHLPSEMEYYLEKSPKINAHNAGILGGNKIATFHDYCEEAFNMLSQNGDKLNSLSDPGSVNFIAEQFLFTCMAQKREEKVSVLLDDVMFERNYSHVANFSKVPSRSTYIHPVASYKRRKRTCLHLARRFQTDHPETYEKIMNCLSANGIKKRFFISWTKEQSSFHLPRKFEEQISIASHHENHNERTLDFLHLANSIIDFQVSMAPNTNEWSFFLSTQYQDMEYFVRLSQNQRNNLTLRVSPFCMLILTSWQWTIKKHLNFIDLFSHNSRRSPKEILYVTFPEEKTCRLAMMPLQPLYAAVMHTLQTEKDIRSVMHDIKAYFSNEDLQDNHDALQELISEVITELIFMGLVVITPNAHNNYIV